MQGSRPGFKGRLDEFSRMTEVSQVINKWCDGRYASVVHSVVTRSADMAIQQRGFMTFLKVGICMSNTNWGMRMYEMRL